MLYNLYESTEAERRTMNDLTSGTSGSPAETLTKFVRLSQDTSTKKVWW